MELIFWIQKQDLLLITPQPALVCDGDRALVVVGKCGCGAPLLRECKRGATAECCDEPLKQLRD